MSAAFYKLNKWYKKVIYYVGWAYAVFMIGWLILLILYIARDKTKKKVENELVFNYQKVPYWFGWILTPFIIIFFIWLFWPV